MHAWTARPFDLAKMLAHFHDWQRGDQLPGRTMSYLKTARLPIWLAECAAGGDERAAGMLAAWEPWERAKAGPQVVLEALVAGGLEDLLAGATA